MRSGTLRETVVIQQPPTSLDSLGQRSGTWTDYATRRASVEYVDATETNDGAEVVRSVGGLVVTFRYLAGLTSFCRVKWGARYLQIEAVKHDTKRRETVLTCREAT